MGDSVQVTNELDATAINPVGYDNSTVINSALNTQNLVEKGAVLGGYTIDSKMSTTSGEADIYICYADKNKYVAKIYRRKMAIKDEVSEKLKCIDSPYVAKVYATGEYNGFPYEILPYYQNGSLEGKTFSFEELKTSIIPSLNEGLKVLHDNGIIHKDLKPSNIMLLDNQKDVAIIDFGISSVREGTNTVVVTKTGMTYEYSAPETFKNLFLTESDYYSLGVTIYELFCGHTPYSKMTQEEIEKYVSIQKLPLPENMTDELRVLISALTYSDITNRKNKSNPNRRWGYEEILKWCVGIKQPIPGEADGGSVSLSGNMSPYKFLRKTYRDKHELIISLASNWEDGKKQLYRGLLSSFFKSFDAELAGYCIDAEENIDKEDEDVLFLKTLYKIDPSLTTFYWKGKRYEDLCSLGDEYLKSLWKNDTAKILFFDELIRKEVISEYIRCVDETADDGISSVMAIESSYKTFGNSKRDKFVNYYLLAYLLSGRHTLRKNGIEFDSVSKLTTYMKELLEKSYDLFEGFCHELLDNDGNLDEQFESWLVILGKRKDIDEWRRTMT